MMSTSIGLSFLLGLLITLLFLVVHIFSTSPFEVLDSRLGEFVGIGYDSPGVFDESFMPGARQGACVWSVPHLERTYVSGGIGYARKGTVGSLGDMWVYDWITTLWSFIRGYDTAPVYDCLPVGDCGLGSYGDFRDEVWDLPVAYASCWLDLFEPEYLIHFGGLNGYPEGYLSSNTWIFHNVESRWLRLHPNWAPTYSGILGDYPHYLIQSSHTTMEVDGMVYVFGGWTYNRYDTSDALYGFDLTSWQWVWLHGVVQFSCCPYSGYSFDQDGLYGPRGVFNSSLNVPTRFGSVMWNDDVDFVYVFGGSTWNLGDNVHIFNDLWAWKVSAGEWAFLAGVPLSTTIDPPSQIVSADFHADNWPSGRCEVGYWMASPAGDVVVLMGGKSRDGDFMRDLWLFSITRNMWKFESGVVVPAETSNTIFGIRLLGNLWREEAKERTMFFSGLGPDVFDAIGLLKDLGAYYGMHAECSGHGDFSYNSPDIWNYAPGNDSCACNANFVGDICEFWKCFGSWHNESGVVCSGRGTCKSHNTCICDDHVSGDNCSIWECDGVENFDITNVCSGHGDCVDIETCTCVNSNYTGQYCHFWSCYGTNITNSSVCSGNGDCVDTDDCDCDPEFHGERCEFFECDGIAADNETYVCGGHGDCVDGGTCVCQDDVFGHFAPPFCTGCTSQFKGAGCLGFDCFGFDQNASGVCSGHGDCEAPQTCLCDAGYYGENCSDHDCYDINFGVVSCPLSDLDCEAVCHGAGICVSPDLCNCTSPNAYGSECSEIIYPAYFWKEMIVEVPYSLPIEWVVGKFTEYFNCSMIFLNSEALGTPGHPPTCRWAIFLHATSKIVIDLGDGTPVKELTELVVDTWSKEGETITIPVAPFVPSIVDVPTGFEKFWWTLVVAVSLVVLIGIVLGVVVVIIACLQAYYGKKAQKFDDIEGLDVVVDEYIASKRGGDGDFTVRVNKSLFQIEYNSIHLKDRLGSGGSGAVIYSADWKDQLVAVKVFPTKDLCDNESWEEFEKEIAIMGSVSHPGLLTFYGCACQEPRVAIVMELCENGDLTNFLKKGLERGPDYLSFFHKCDLLAQMADAMDYLHTRKIIHRDLKPENVLLTQALQCKIMDFGLSRRDQTMSQAGSGKAMTKRLGTSLYMAPELVLSNQYGNKVDVFSFGILMWVLANEIFHPYPDQKEFMIELKVANDPLFRPSIASIKPFKGQKWYVDLMTSCWSHDSEDRLPFSEILSVLTTEMIKLGPEFRLGLFDKDSWLSSKDSFHRLGSFRRVHPTVSLRPELLSEEPLGMEILTDSSSSSSSSDEKEEENLLSDAANAEFLFGTGD